MDLELLLEKLGPKLAEEADVRAVFGDPLVLGEHTVVPVAVVGITLDGEGGGRADLSAMPVGYLCEEDGRVVFKAIELRPRPLPTSPAARRRAGARPKAARRRR